MQYLFEIKYRIFLIIFVWFYSIVICYYYKEILFFFLINKLVLKTSSVYFVYTNITELFSVYIKLIEFFTIQIVFYYSFHHLFSFLTPALYKKEFFILRNLIYLLIMNWVLLFFIILLVLIPLIWTFFKSFQKLLLINSIHLEIKINEFFEFFKNIYFFTQFYFSNLLIIMYLLKNFYNEIYAKKVRKFVFFLFLIFLTIINPFEIINQIAFYIVFVIFYEFTLFLYILKKHTKILE